MLQAPCPERDLIDRHFRGRISPPQEHELRAHLPGCVDCRRRYDRHLLADELSGGLGRADRLAIGLGLPRGPASGRRWAIAHLAVIGAAAVAVAALLVASQQDEPSAPPLQPPAASARSTPLPR
jgi:hypothetical protein